MGNGETDTIQGAPRGIARQPVFDRDRRLVGFELLYRGGWGGGVDDETATLRTLAVAVAEVGLPSTVGPHRTFVHVTRRVLEEGWHRSLTPGQTVLQLVDPGSPAAGTIDLVTDVRRQGYPVCLDRYSSTQSNDWLIAHVDHVNIDVQAMTLAEMTTAVRSVHQWGAKAVAERIEDGPRLTAARHAEFDFLKGFHLGRPERVTGQPIHCPAPLLKMLEDTLLDPQATAAEIAELLDRDDDVRAAVQRVAAATPRFDDETVRRIAHLVALAAEPAPTDEPVATAVSPATCHWVVEPV